jgi:hypothetical protein
VAWSPGDADPLGKIFDLAPGAGWGRGDQAADKAVDRGPPGDVFGCHLLGRPQCEVRLVGLAALQEGAGRVYQETCPALGDSDIAQVDGACNVDRRSGVAEGDRDVDVVKFGVGRAECCPAQVAVFAQARGGVLGFGEQLVGCVAVVVLGGGDRSAQQEVMRPELSGQPING